MVTFWTLAAAVGLVSFFGGVWWLAQHVRHARRQRRDRAALQHARRLFRQRREWLEARFLTRASERGKPRHLIWSGCEFDDDVAFARDRSTGQLRALVAVTIRFDAEEGSAMEDVDEVGALRAATAVFRFDGQHWSSEGQAVFNLNPEETIRHFHHELEVVD